MPKDVTAETKIAALAGHPVEIGNSSFVANAQFARDGMDLTLTAPDGHAVRIEGYFAQTTPPDITTPDGAHFSPQMISAFLPPQHPGEFAAAANAPANDATPAGKITEVVGHATIIHAGGGQEAVKLGALVHQGDIIQTDAKGAVNILFADNTTFAISENARLAVDQFSYNASEHKGSSFFSMLQGVFVYTSGLIGKEDPGSVGINTPVGSIGIRGTVVAGEIHGAGHDSHITILDGAIVVSNAGGTLEMHSSFDTATLSGYNTAPADHGQMDATSFATNYSALKGVSAATFNSISNGTFHAAPDAHAPTPGPAHDAPVQMPDAGPLTHTTGLATATPAVNFGDGVHAFDGSTTVTATTAPLSTAASTGGDHVISAAQSGISGNNGTAPHNSSGPGGGTVGPTPDISFTFGTHYTNGTGTTSDDGINVTWTPGEVVGTINLANFSTTPIISISGFAGNNDYHGTSLNYDTVSSPQFDTVAENSQTILHYDPATGNIALMDPFAASNLNSDFTFTITATDPGTSTVLATETVTFHINEFYPTGTPDVSVGDITGQTSVVPGGAAANDTINSNSTLGNNEVLFGRDGSDTLIAEAGRPDVLFGGAGDDLLIVPDMSFYYVDGGTNVTATGDTLQIGSTAMATQTFNFEADDNVKNIEHISIVQSNVGSVGQTVTLTLQDVFEMTDANHTLQISNNGAGYGSTVVIDNAFSSQDFNAGVVSNAIPGDQTTTYTGTYNGATVTLVVHQGNASANDGITTHVTA